MIEVPGAALAADALAAKADFFAIGTNDLIQYTLAIDRSDEQVAHLYNPLHPAVLRLIQFAVETALRRGMPISVCGEMAGEPRFAALLLGLGLRNLSMAPRNIPRVSSASAASTWSPRHAAPGRSWTSPTRAASPPSSTTSTPSHCRTEARRRGPGTGGRAFFPCRPGKTGKKFAAASKYPAESNTWFGKFIVLAGEKSSLPTALAGKWQGKRGGSPAAPTPARMILTDPFLIMAKTRPLTL
jgi:hypothetical protein